jgi:hypothetical protein
MDEKRHARLLRRIMLDVGLQATVFVVAVILVLTSSGTVHAIAIVASILVLLHLLWRITVLVYTIRHPEVTGEDG